MCQSQIVNLGLLYESVIMGYNCLNLYQIVYSSLTKLIGVYSFSLHHDVCGLFWSSDLLLAGHPEPLLLEPLQLTALLVEQQLVGDEVGVG